MSFLVAGVVCILAFLAGVTSFITIPFFADKAETEGGESAEYKLTPAAIPKFFTKENLTKILLLAVAAMFVGLAGYLSYEKETDLLYLCKQMLVALVFLCAMIIDKGTRKIPNVLILVTFIIGAILLGVEWIISSDAFLSSLIAAGVGCCGCLVLFYILARLTKGGIGMGDVKLIAVSGWILGLASTIFIVLAAMLLCSLCAIYMLIGKKKNKNDTLPFGPFLFFGYMMLLVLFNV